MSQYIFSDLWYDNQQYIQFLVIYPIISHYIPVQTMKVPLVVFDALSFVRITRDRSCFLPQRSRLQHAKLPAPVGLAGHWGAGVGPKIAGAVGAEVFWHKKYSCCISLWCVYVYNYLYTYINIYIYIMYYESQPGSWLVVICERSENRGSGGGSCQTGQKWRK